MSSISFDIWSVFIIIGIVQGLYVLSILPFKLNWKLKHNYFLLGIILALLWYQLEFLSIRKPFNVPLNIFYGTRHGSWFLLGPLLYFYTRLIYNPSEKIGYRLWLHFSPFIIVTIIIPLFYTEFLSFRQVHYGMLTVFDSYNKSVSPIQYFYSSIFILQFIHFSIYLMASKRTLRSYKRNLQNDYSTIDSKNLQWLHHLTFSLLAVLVFASVFLFILFYTRIYRRHLDYLYVIPMSYIMYLMSYKLANISWKETKPDHKKYEKSSLDATTAELNATKLKEYMSTHKPYLDPKLRLSKLAEELGISSHHLSQTINEKFKANFYDFINEYRVNEVIDTIKKSSEKDKISLLEIAYKVGFNNKTSFTNSFKKFTGHTPSSYKSLYHKK